MNEKIPNNNTRRRVFGTLAAVTLVFFALLGAALLLHSRLPVIRENRVTAALERGDLTRARAARRWP